MTAKEAAAKWGYTLPTVTQHAKAGRIPGAKMIQYAPKERARWFIPDDAEKPELKRICKKPRLVIPNSNDPVDYVWRNQDHSIGLLALVMKIPTRQVVALYDKACEKYLRSESDAK